LAASIYDNEKELFLGVANGDEMAFRKLYDQYHQVLATYIYRLTRSMAETEEIVHDVFLKLWMTRETLHGIDNVKAYLFVISRNHALNVIKKRIRQLFRSRQWQKEMAEEEAKDEKGELLYSLVDQAIDQLPPQQKKVFLLARYERLTYEEVGVKLGISRETVKSYLKLATHSITHFIKNHVEISLLILFLHRG
jgi:RNA polymerase sigma-70 factor (family 1)